MTDPAPKPRRATTRKAPPAEKPAPRETKGTSLVLSVVVPTRNEATNVKPLFERISKACGDVEFEVCFVDDSNDTTTTVLGQLEESDPRVHCLFRSGSERSGGLSTAVIAGLRMARGRYVCVMDADLQHPPELIPQLLGAARDGADLVVASRYFAKGSAEGLAGPGRRLVSAGARTVAKLLFSEARRSTDPLSGYFLCRRDLIDGIEFRPVGFKILLELLVCVPGLKVTDVPLQFADRASGESKATMGQGWLFLKHVNSLFAQVSGSARPWKFSMVGISGLVIFLALLELFHRSFGVDVIYAFFPAFVPSLLWNTLLNRLWTFSDRRGRLLPRESQAYFLLAIINGAIAYGVYRYALGAKVDVLWAGLMGAVVAMLCNGLLNLSRVGKRPFNWSKVSTDREIIDGLARLAKAVGADRAYVLPPGTTRTRTSVPHDLMERVLTLRRATLWTEAASHRAQRRTNIDLTSTLLVPVVNGGKSVGMVVCERRSPTAYPSNALEKATRAVEAMVPALVQASDERLLRLEERMRVAKETG